jgi:methionine-rich copper-binding protein CopC
MRTRTLALVLGVLAWTYVLGVPPAHAATNVLESSVEPGPVDELVVRFDGPVDVAQLHLWLEQPAGVAAIGPATHVDGDPSVVRIAIPPGAPGARTLGWHLIGLDGVPATGTVPFEIGADAPDADPLRFVGWFAAAAVVAVVLARRTALAIARPRPRPRLRPKERLAR